MADALAALPVEIVWLTTWEEMANEIIVPALGWEPLSVVDRSQYLEEPWWKLNAIKAHIESGGGPFIWADDNTKPYLAGCEVPHLLISPDSSVGIAQRHLKEMRLFIENISQENSPIGG